MPHDVKRTDLEGLPERSRLRPDAVPEGVRRQARILAQAGGQAYVVGGAVRDLLLGRSVRDWDLATDLLPQRILDLFSRTYGVGAKFGTVLVVEKGETYEVTTFRRDGRYKDGRHPEEVEYSQRIEEDLGRRDFTINALAYDPEADHLVDPFGGVQDLHQRLLRAVGDPVRRFWEDGLRLLRAVRLAAELGFEIEEETVRALVLCAPNLELISLERIRDEFNRLLESPRPASGLSLLHETGLLRRFLPELAACYGVPQNPHHAYDVFHHSLAAVEQAAPENRVLRLAALFHDLGKPETRVENVGTATFYGHQFTGERIADRSLRRLRYPNEERERVAHLVRHHMFHYSSEWTDGAVRRFLRSVGADQVEDLFRTRQADTLGNGLRQRVAPELAELRRRIEMIIAQDNALSVRDLAIDGNDLMAHLGIGPGPELGQILRALLEEVLDDPSLNQRETLLARATRLRPQE